MESLPRGLVSTGDVLARVPGVTERQLHYWVLKEAITPAHFPQGQGHPWGWSLRDIRRLTAIAEYIEGMQACGATTVRLETIGSIWDQLESSEWVTIARHPVMVNIYLRSGGVVGVKPRDEFL